MHWIELWAEIKVIEAIIGYAIFGIILLLLLVYSILSVWDRIDRLIGAIKVAHKLKDEPLAVKIQGRFAFYDPWKDPANVKYGEAMYRIRKNRLIFWVLSKLKYI